MPPKPPAGQTRRRHILFWLKHPVVLLTLGGLLGMPTACFTIQITSKAQAEQRLAESRQRVYSNLSGLKAAFVRATVDRLHVQLTIAIYKQKLRITRANEYVPLLTDQQAHEQEILARYADVLRDLFQYLGEARVVFEVRPDLDAKLKAVEGFRDTRWESNTEPTSKTLEEVDAMERKLRAEIPDMADKAVVQPFDALLPLLLPQVPRS